jgi:UDP-glucose:(heptosyl)LPS alpha-1,3-glucosyltransferase
VIAEPLSGPAPTEVSGRRPRVALVAHGIHDGGGMERAFAELIRRAHTQFAFTVFSSELASDLRALVDWRPTRVPARPIPVRILTFFVRVSLPLARAQVELVHVLGAIAPNRADVVTVQYCHAGSLAKTGRLSPGGGPMLRRLNRSVARAMAIAAERFCYRPGRTRRFASVSEGVRLELEQHYPGVPIAITPNGVDLERFHPDATVRAQLRAAERVGDDPVCLFVGGDWDRKGLGPAIEAVSLARQAAPIRLWVVGRGESGRFAQLAERLGVGDLVRFFGPRADTERFYQAADIFVLPTEYETFSLAAYEAAASSLAIVATGVSGVENLVHDGKTGLLVTRSPADVAQALLTLATDPELRLRLGRAARLRASAFTWDRSVDAVLRAYWELLELQAALPA